jgi:hypothetical protein
VIPADRRYVRGRRCPICHGADNDPRSAERRCFGFLSSDGEYAHCSREEHAGTLKQSEGSQTYGHRIAGPCGCGAQHSDPVREQPTESNRIVATYDYRDERGELVYQVVRFEPKTFRQRRPDPDRPSSWLWSLGDVRRVLYHLDRVIEADPVQTVYVVEGEKDVEAVETLGLIATCNPQGAGKWSAVADCAAVALAGRPVVVIADADDKGRAHAADVAERLADVAASVRTLELPGAKDAADWIRDGGNADQLEALVARPSDVKTRWHRAPELVDLILKYAGEPLVSLKLGCDELAVIRQGGIVPVMGPTGAGKSSLVAGMLIAHEGPTVVLSRELPADELAARAIGMQCDASWLDVLTGKVPRHEMERVLMPRLYVLDRKNATLGALCEAIQAAQRDYPGEQVLVAIDYVQILESVAAEARAKVADILAQIDDIARAYRVVVLAISQMSRASSRAARAGEAIGADSTDGGAESAAIERFATMTLSIGASGPEREDGTKAVDLSIGKGRMTGGDRVLPMSYCGRSGRWRLTGEARPAAEVKAEREGQRDTAKQHAAELAMVAAADKATEPQKREDVAAVAFCSKDIRRAAMAALLARGELVEVARKSPRSRAWKVWRPDKARAAGIPMADSEAE